MKPRRTNRAWFLFARIERAAFGHVPPTSCYLVNWWRFVRGGIYLPTGFEVKNGRDLSKADRALRQLIPTFPKKGSSIERNLYTANEILDLIKPTLTVSDQTFDWEAMKALLKFYSHKQQNKVDLFVETGRELNRILSGDKSGLSIVGTSLRDVLRRPSRQNPALVLLQQVGRLDLNWSGHPFWWPVLAAPPNVEPCVFATKVAS